MPAREQPKPATEQANPTTGVRRQVGQQTPAAPPAPSLAAALSGDADLLQLQRVVGNRAVARLIESSELDQRMLPISVSVIPPPAPAGPMPLQRAKADVTYKVGAGGVQSIVGEAVGQGAIGGQTHSEQRIWARVRDPIVTGLGTRGAHVRVNFAVDTTICHLCSPWFENTVWTTLNNTAQARGSTFELTVTVGGNTVTVDGTDTIWPPEVADADTFDRLSEYDRAVRFFTDNRDQEGNLLGGQLDGHVKLQADQLMDVVSDYQLVGDDVEQTLDAATNDVIRVQSVRYEVPEDADEDRTIEEIMHEKLDVITVYDVISSGRLTVPEIDVSVSMKHGKEEWYRELRRRIVEWLEDEIEDRLYDYRKQKPNPHMG
jgi:hypothetical protein